MSKQKRMIYIYEENIAKYDAMENKSEWINKHLKELPDVAPVVDENQTSLSNFNDFEEKIRKLRGTSG